MDSKGNIYEVEEKEKTKLLKNLEGKFKEVNHEDFKLLKLMPILNKTELKELKTMNRHDRRKFYALNKNRIKE